MRIKNRDILVKILSAIGDLPRGLLYEHTATGNPATFNTNVAKPMELTVGMNPVQDLHGYDNPWVGGAGKNLWSGVEQGTINQATGENGDTTSGVYRLIEKVPVSVKGTYTISGLLSESGKIRIFYYSSSAYLSSDVKTASNGIITFTVGDNVAYIRAQASESVYTPTTQVQLESGSTATSYAPYSNICPISGWDQAKVTNGIPSTWGLTKNYYINSTGVVTADTNGILQYTDAIPVVSGRTYIFSAHANVNSSQSYRRIHAYTNDVWEEQIDAELIPSSTSRDYSFTFTVPANVNYIRVSYAQNDTNVMFYNSTVTIPFTSTNYGGTVTLNKDGSADLVVDHQFYEFDGSNDEDWHVATNANYKYGYINIVDFSNANTLINNEFEIKAIGHSTSDIGLYMFRNNGVPQIRIRYSLSTTMSVSDLRTWLSQNPLQICYSLATTVTYHIDNAGQLLSLLGINNVWANTNETVMIKYMKRG